MKPEILYEDDEMIICSKPAGVLAQSGRSFDVDMVSALLSYRRSKGEDVYIGVINRLDRPVSGLMAFAKSSASAARLNDLLQKGNINKTYLALITGMPEGREGRLTDMLIKDGKNNISRTAAPGEKGAKQAQLEYEIVRSRQQQLDNGGSVPVSLVKIRLITGRHHQIRVQFASRGYAVIGDMKYASYYSGVQNGVAYASGDTVTAIMRAIGIDRGSIALCACSLDIDGRHFEIIPDFAEDFLGLSPDSFCER